MAKGRWQHLDLRKPATTPSAAPVIRPDEDEPSDLASAGAPSGGPAVHPDVRHARMLYLLRQFEQCADLLASAMEANPEIPGALKLRGLALGRLDCSADAAQCLRAARAEAPDDPELLASLISAEIRAGLIPERMPRPASAALAEVLGAAAWARGRQALWEERMVAAAHAFQEAGDLFVENSPPETAPERVAAAYVGETVSWLAAGQFDAAQRGFSRLSARVRLPEATLRFARGLYELADALRDLDPIERALELAPLVEAVAAAQIRLRFYDGAAPVEMYWENLP